MTAYENPVYRYRLLYPTGWATGASDPALVSFTGPGSSSIVVDYDVDDSRTDVTAYKAVKLAAFQGTVSNFATVAEAKDNAVQTWKITATYTQGGVAKKGLIFLDYPKPRGFFVVLSAATADFDGLQERFNQVLASWQVPAIVK